MSGKGSHPRPISDRARYESEWDRIFGPARTPLPHSPMATDAESAASEGAAVPVLPTDGQGDSSNGV